jgi:hypothetical protein
MKMSQYVVVLLHSNAFEPNARRDPLTAFATQRSPPSLQAYCDSRARDRVGCGCDLADVFQCIIPAKLVGAGGSWILRTQPTCGFRSVASA